MPSYQQRAKTIEYTADNIILNMLTCYNHKFGNSNSDCNSVTSQKIMTARGIFGSYPFLHLLWRGIQDRGMQD